MKSVLIEDFKNQTYRTLTRGVLTNFLLENKKLPFAVAFDSMVIHYKPWMQIVFDPRAKSAWKAILEQYYESDAYRALNSTIAGDPMLAKYATIHFLNSLFKACKQESKNENQQGVVQEALERLDAQARELQKMREAQVIVRAIASELINEAKEVLEDIEAIQSFSHVGIPVAQYLEKPDEFRKRAKNKIIVNLIKFIKKLRKEAPSLKQAKAPTLVGGRPLGVKKLQRWSELTSILPTEIINDDLLTYKIANRSVLVRERYGGISNYVVYLDKSGSMADSIVYYVSPTQREHVPKISFAAASALALAQQLKKYSAKMTLKLFDVEVHEEITDYAQLIETLLKISADSGTNISKVLEDALKHRDEKIVVVTDGIDEVSEEAVKKAKSANLDVTFVFIHTSNKLLEKSFRCVKIQEAKPSILLEV